jgi:hypothetical protein
MSNSFKLSGSNRRRSFGSRGTDPWTVQPAAGPREKRYIPVYEDACGFDRVEELKRGSATGKFVDGKETYKFPPADDYQFSGPRARQILDQVESQALDSADHDTRDGYTGRKIREVK